MDQLGVRFAPLSRASERRKDQLFGYEIQAVPQRRNERKSRAHRRS